jgi:hypothetical protein
MYSIPHKTNFIRPDDFDNGVAGGRQLRNKLLPNMNRQVLLRVSMPRSQSITGIALFLLMTVDMCMGVFPCSLVGSAVSRPLQCLLV